MAVNTNYTAVMLDAGCDANHLLALSLHSQHQGHMGITNYPVDISIINEDGELVQIFGYDEDLDNQFRLVT